MYADDAAVEKQVLVATEGGVESGAEIKQFSLAITHIALGAPVSLSGTPPDEAIVFDATDGLVDALHLFVYPIALGEGERQERQCERQGLHPDARRQSCDDRSCNQPTPVACALQDKHLRHERGGQPGELRRDHVAGEHAAAGSGIRARIVNRGPDRPENVLGKSA